MDNAGGDKLMAFELVGELGVLLEVKGASCCFVPCLKDARGGNRRLVLGRAWSLGWKRSRCCWSGCGRRWTCSGGAGDTAALRPNTSAPRIVD